MQVFVSFKLMCVFSIMLKCGCLGVVCQFCVLFVFERGDVFDQGSEVGEGKGVGFVMGLE